MVLGPEPGAQHLRPAVRRVHDALVAHGVAPEIRELEASTRTAVDAAAAVGTTVERIVKSLVFLADGRPVLALVSGANRLDPGKLAELAGGSVTQASAEEVRQATGFAIGGVPPVGHSSPLPVWVDRDLLRFDLVWAAAGTPNAVFGIAPETLVRVSGGRVADLAV